MSGVGKRVLIVTGLSGAGKSITLNSLEDMGFFCIDNLPLFLGRELARHLADDCADMAQVAITIDGRAADFFEQWQDFVESFRRLPHAFSLLFLDCDDDVLLRRFSQMRRMHPLAAESDTVAAGIALERQRLAEIRQAADLVINTTNLTPNELRATLCHRFGGGDHEQKLLVRVISFGFKSGLPPEADLVFDVRFLPNPYYDPALRARTGKEREVADYVLDTELGRDFLALLLPQIKFLLPRYRQAGKVSLTIAIGCTGGRHRSVAVAERLGQWLQEQAVQPRVSHRDIGLD